MKKIVFSALLAGAALSSLSAHAQLANYATGNGMLNNDMQPEVIIGHSKASFYTPAVNSVAEGVWYKSPKGVLSTALWGYLTVPNSGWGSEYQPIMLMPAFTPVTFQNMSTDKASTEWSLWKSDKAAIPFKSTEVKDNDLTVVAGGPFAIHELPVLKSGTKQYYWGDKYSKTATYPSYTQVDTLIDMGYEIVPLYQTMIQGSQSGYYVGTLSDRIDFNGDGKPETVYCDGFHMFFPKPIAPLAVNRIDIPITSYGGFFFEGFGKLKFTIYKVKKNSLGQDIFGDVIFTTELDDDNFAQRPGELNVGRQAHLLIYLTDDEANGFLTLNEDFAIEMTGFQADGVDLGPRCVSRYDAAQQSPDVAPMVYRDFINKQGEYVGSTIYNNNMYGIPISFYSCYDVMKVDAEKGAIAVGADGAQCTAKATVYTQRGWYKKGGVNYTLDELPEWVKSVKATKVENGVHELAVVCDPLPAGVTSRSCTVHIKSFAGNLSDDVITITQGEGTPGVKGDVNGDGKVDVADVNIIIDIILGNATVDQYPAADVTGDGKVDVADVNAVIDIILGL